jgi:hypothetical protein
MTSDGHGFFATVDSDEELDQFILDFLEWIDYYLGCVTRFHQLHGR